MAPALTWLLTTLCIFTADPRQTAAAASVQDVHAVSDAAAAESLAGRSLLQTDVDCGEKGQACCPGADNRDWCRASRLPASGSRRCSDDSGIGTCLACGGLGEACCQQRPDLGPECARRAVCMGSRCEPCGGFGELCCASATRSCVMRGRFSRGCTEGRCSTVEGPCGALGQPCCLDEDNRATCSQGSFIPSGIGLLCSGDSTCIACGRTGEPCCEAQARSSGRGRCDDGNICAVSGECVACGERGEPCCQRPFGGSLFCSGDVVCDTDVGCCGMAICGDVDVSFGFNALTFTPSIDDVTPTPVMAAPAPRGVTITLPDPASGSAGAAAIGVALDASAFLTEAEFNATRDQVVAFIDRSSEVTTTGVANANVYYVMTFTSTLGDSTGVAFITNTDRQASRQVRRFGWRGRIAGQERSFPAAALNALADRFESFSRPASASAVVVFASADASPENSAATDAAAQRLRSSVPSSVSIAGIALTFRTNLELLSVIAAISVTRQALASRTFVFTRVESLLITSTSTAGGIAIAIALDTSSAVSEAEFLIARSQLISFIDTSSGVDTAAGPNRNIYYLNTFSAAVRSSTSVFLSNAERQVSRLVEQFFVYRGGSIDLAVAIDDLTAQISSLTVSTPALALVVAAGSSSRAAAVAAADRLRSSYDGGVSLGCVPLGSVSSENVATLAAIASTGLVRSSLSLRAPSLLSIAAQCTSVLRSLDADGDGTTDTVDACPADAAKVEAGRCGCGAAETLDCGDVPRCQGSLVIGITFGMFSPASFDAAKEQIITFVDITSGVNKTAAANSNRYYVNSFNGTVVGTTASFLTNSDRRVSRSIQSSFEFGAGGLDIAAGLEDLTAQFRRLPGPTSGLAVVVTNGRSSRAAAEAAADELRAEGVTVAVVAIRLRSGDTRGVDLEMVEAVASTGSDGEELVFESTRVEDIVGLLAAVITRIDRDGDGVDDCRDGCPSDPAKTSPGRCGCGRAEAPECGGAPEPEHDTGSRDVLIE